MMIVIKKEEFDNFFQIFQKFGKGKIDIESSDTSYIVNIEAFTPEEYYELGRMVGEGCTKLSEIRQFGVTPITKNKNISFNKTMSITYYLIIIIVFIAIIGAMFNSTSNILADINSIKSDLQKNISIIDSTYEKNHKIAFPLSPENFEVKKK